MQVRLDLPDELSIALAAFGPDLSRAAFEAIALEAYRERKLTTAQLRRILGFESRYELDGFLKKHEVWLEYTWRDLEQDRATHRRLGVWLVSRVVVADASPVRWRLPAISRRGSADAARRNLTDK